MTDSKSDLLIKYRAANMRAFGIMTANPVDTVAYYSIRAEVKELKQRIDELESAAPAGDKRNTLRDRAATAMQKIWPDGNFPILKVLQKRLESELGESVSPKTLERAKTLLLQSQAK